MKAFFVITRLGTKSIYFIFLFSLLISCGIYPSIDTGGGENEPKPKPRTEPKPGKIDAAFTHSNGHIYFFSGNKFIEWKPGKGVLKTSDGSVQQTLGVDGFTQIPKKYDTGIDAILKTERSTPYFVKDGNYLVVGIRSSGEGSLSSDSFEVQNLPPFFTTNIDAIVVHPTSKKTYFFKEDKYAVISKNFFRTMNLVKPKVKIIGKGGWRSLPGFFRSNIDAALVHPTSKNIYFFKKDKYCVWKPGKGIIAPAIRTRGVYGWKGVMFN